MSFAMKYFECSTAVKQSLGNGTKTPNMGTYFLHNYKENLGMKPTFLGRDLPKATAGVEQNSPMFTPGVAN